MTTAWAGTLVVHNSQIPIALHPAVRDNTIALNMCCDTHNSEVKQMYHCEEGGGHYIAPGDLARAFKSGNKLIKITKEEREAIDLPTEREIHISEYRHLSEMRWEMVKDTFNLSVEPGAELLYAAFVKALSQNNWVALGRITMRTHDHLCAIVPNGNGIVLLLLHWQSQMTTIPVVETREASVAIVAVFTEIMARDFKLPNKPLLAQFKRDRHEAAREELIKSKVEGALMPRLRKSIKTLRRGKTTIEKAGRL